uniref:A disintegrin and metalloproteinase with thrombospondin motifs 10 n=1 Tax=Zonotrichia albicollis TaxID=44394 RepID=A0A8D2MUL8_ZONAL
MATAWRLLTWTLTLGLAAIPMHVLPSPEEFLSSLDHYEIAFPIQVDQNGDFLTFDMRRQLKPRPRRSLPYEPSEQQVFYKVSAHHTQFLLNLTLHSNLLAEHFTVEYWKRDGMDWQHDFHEDCHYAGHLQDQYLSSKVAISNCNGLHGVIVADEEEYFIEPLSPGANVSMGGEGKGSPHVVYKRSSLQYPHMDAACGVMGRCPNHLLLKSSPKPPGEILEKNQIFLLNLRFSWVCFYPFLVVWGFHLQKDPQIPVLASPHESQVAKLFQDSSLGNIVNILVTRLILLTEDQVSWALLSLSCVCTSLQELCVPPGCHSQEFPLMYDICIYKNKPCGTLGEWKSDTLSFASAEQGTGDSSQWPWGGCSWQDLISCCPHHAEDTQCPRVPVSHPAGASLAQASANLGFVSLCLPSFLCPPKSPPLQEVCSELWCLSKSNRCITNSIPAAEGTICQTNTIDKGVRQPWAPHTAGRDGLGPFSTGGSPHCQGCCPCPPGAGVPEELVAVPCCQDCPPGSQDFRELQCAEFDSVPFRGKYYTWKTYRGGGVKACSLNCLAEGFNFYTERAAAVVDGTPCRQDSNDICVNGECKHVGCDRVLGSDSKEDKCRVCGGDGSSCETIEGVFNHSLPEGGYEEVIQIPKGSVHIDIRELNLSINYLGELGGEYFINGKLSIDPPRRFDIAGTTFHYRRSPEEPESLEALGPTNITLFVMVGTFKPLLGKGRCAGTQCFMQSCLGGCGCRRARAVCRALGPSPAQPSSAVPIPSWAIGNWSECSRSCNEGVRTRSVFCKRKISASEEKTLDDASCPQPRPKMLEPCNNQTCPPEWVALDWSEASAQRRDTELGKGDKEYSRLLQRLWDASWVVTVVALMSWGCLSCRCCSTLPWAGMAPASTPGTTPHGPSAPCCVQGVSSGAGLLWGDMWDPSCAVAGPLLGSEELWGLYTAPPHTQP